MTINENRRTEFASKPRDTIDSIERISIESWKVIQETNEKQSHVNNRLVFPINQIDLIEEIEND